MTTSEGILKSLAKRARDAVDRALRGRDGVDVARLVAVVADDGEGHVCCAMRHDLSIDALEVVATTLTSMVEREKARAATATEVH